MKPAGLIAALALVATASTFATARAAGYTITDLGTLGGTSSAAFGLNARGRVVGQAATTGDASRDAVLFGTPNVAVATFGGTLSQANAINDAGIVVGANALPGNATTRAFAALGTTLVDLGTLGGTGSRALAINDAGQIAGDAQTPADAATHAFRYENGAMTDLGTLGGIDSTAYGINAEGRVVGQAATATARHAFLYDAGSMADLGVLGTGDLSVAYAINNHDEVVGASNVTPGGPMRPFLRQNGQLKNFGTLGGSAATAYAINVSTLIVGESLTANDAATHAFLYEGGRMIDLNTLVPNRGWELITARAINDAGQIVGTGLLNGQSHAYILSPIVPVSPEATAPRIYVNGARRLTTDRRAVRIEGSVGGTVASVKYRLGGKGAYRTATGTTGWRFRAKLAIGRNLVQVIAVAPDGRRSLPTRVVIVRK